MEDEQKFDGVGKGALGRGTPVRKGGPSTSVSLGTNKQSARVGTCVCGADQGDEAGSRREEL